MNSEKEKKYTEQLRKSILAIKKLQTQLKDQESRKLEPIAIVGMGCRFPGESNSPAQYWDLLSKAIDATTEIPAIRWDKDKYFSTDPNNTGTTFTKEAGFINNIELFDNLFFGISNREALYMDPLYRHLLETTWEALENTGLDLKSLNGSNTAVYMGFGDNTEYASKHILSGSHQHIDPYSLTGYMTTAGSGRISYLLGLEGGNVSLSTGCSSSLVATHLACQSLRNGESDMALAGGANLIISPQSYIALANMGALSADGRCHTFDAKADGYGRSDGIGVVVLKRLSDAKRDNDFIWSVIKGSAINQDGSSNGFTAPSVKAQIKVIDAALRNAQLTPNDVDFVEAHGTGTTIGDPIEMEALKKAYSLPRSVASPLWVGAVKTNFGHSEGAAGVAGIIKVALSLYHKQIPANLHFEEPNPLINWSGMRIKIPTVLTDWNKSEGLRAGAVSAFGISGTNAHVILQEVENIPLPMHATQLEKENVLCILPISAKTDNALCDYATKYLQYIKQKPEQDWRKICANAAFYRTKYEKRYAFSASSRSELIDKLTAYIDQPSIGSEDVDTHRVVFVFPGQGSQWLGMGKELYENNIAFKQEIDACAKAFEPHVDCDIIEVITHTENELQGIDQIQPVLFAFMVALSAVWKTYGITPDAVVGHSMGEVAAAYVGGYLSLADAAHIICLRSRLLLEIADKGKMLATDLKQEEAEGYIQNLREFVSIGVTNSTSSTVLSGDSKQLEAIHDDLIRQDRFSRFVQVNVASHSPQTYKLAKRLEASLTFITPKVSDVEFYSTVTSTSLTAYQLSASYWADNMSEAVRFSDTLAEMYSAGYDLFLEVSPHPILQAPMEQTFDDIHAKAIVVSSTQKNAPEQASLYRSISLLYSAGIDIEWNQIFEITPKFIDLPTYPWQWNNLWLSSVETNQNMYKPISTALNNTETRGTEQLKENWLELINRWQGQPEEQKRLLCEFIQSQLARLTGIGQTDLKLQTHFKFYGIDSMMRIRLRKSIEKQMNLQLSAAQFTKQENISELADYISRELQPILKKDNDSDFDKLFVTNFEQAQNQINLFCFHDAGGSSSLFQAWTTSLRSDINVYSVELPGRGHNFDAKPILDFQVLIPLLANTIKSKLGTRFCFFGHSMGGIIAVELARYLSTEFEQTADKLFISSARCFSEQTQRVTEYTLSDSELITVFPNIASLFIDDQEMQTIVLDLLRSDLELLSNYKRMSNQPLMMPIVALWGKEDTVVKQAEIERWENETKSSFTFHERPGGHRYIQDDTNFVTNLINEELS